MARAKRDEAEIQATCEELPLQPPSEVIEEVRNNRLKSGVMIYKASWWIDPLTEEKEQMALVHCTCCGQETHLRKVSYTPGCSRNYGYNGDRIGFIDPADGQEKYSGNVCICPKCQQGMDAVHISKIRNEYIIDRYSFMTASVVRKHYVLLGWVAIKKCNKAGEVWLDICRTDAMTVIDKMPVRFTGYISGAYSSISFIDGWVARPNYFTDYETWNWTETFGLHDKDTAGTELEKSGIVEYFERSWNSVPLAAYIKLWAKYPNVENLVRSGNGKILNGVINKCVVNCGWYVQRDVFYVDKAKQYLNFKKAKPHEIIGVDKDELPIVRNIGLDQLTLFKKVKEIEGARLTTNELELAKKFHINGVLEVVGKYGQGIGKILRYLEKQYTKEKKNHGRIDLITAGYIDDYWRMANEVYNGKVPKEVLYPKNLRLAHDRMTNVYETKESEITTKAIKSFAKEMSKLNFQDEETGLFIRPIKTHAELIKEGKTLSHCVASYADDYAAKKTCIFAIRKISSPSKPFFTLEFKNGKVNQNRGKHNCVRTDEVILFEEKWLKFIKKQGVTV